MHEVSASRIRVNASILSSSFGRCRGEHLPIFRLGSDHWDGLAHRATAEVLKRDGKLRGVPPYVARKLRATVELDYSAQVPREIA
jgi:hypothetical protein